MNIKIFFHLTDNHNNCHFDKLSDLKMARSLLVFFSLHYCCYYDPQYGLQHPKIPVTERHSWVTDKIYNYMSDLFSAETNCTLQPQIAKFPIIHFTGDSHDNSGVQKRWREKTLLKAHCAFREMDSSVLSDRLIDRYWSRQAEVKITFSEGKPQSHCQRCWHCCCVRGNLKQEAPSQRRGFMWL